MNKQSFTLIELLVVIAIIGILAGIIVVSMGGANNSAKDAVRKADINQLSKAIMIYKTNNSELELPKETCTIGDSCSSDEIFGSADSLKDPGGSYYVYSSTDGIDYIITAKLSDASDYTFDSSMGKYESLISSGDWINTGLGFQVMKYEARSVDGKANSTASGTPWVNINQIDAMTACSTIGAHLITNNEWTLLARNIESVPSNWSGGVVGSGTLSWGYSAGSGGGTFTNTEVAPNTGDGYEYNIGANTVGPSGDHNFKRVFYLSNGQVIWDLAGNVTEWTSDICQMGSGANYWQNSGWFDWNNSNLSDYEKGAAGPIGNYTAVNGVGRYWGCDANGNALRRGGQWWNGAYAGIFGLYMDYLTVSIEPHIGFRCVR